MLENKIFEILNNYKIIETKLKQNTNYNNLESKKENKNLKEEVYL